MINLYEYDYLGRVTKETDPNGNETAYEYNYAGQVTKQTNAAGDFVSMVYDLAGQTVSVTDANGNTTNIEYDKLGRAIKVTTPFSDTANGETKTYYDKNSNVIKTAVKRSTGNYQTEEYRYDNIGNLLASIANDGTTDVVTQYQYDTANRITKMITGLSSYSIEPAGGAVTQYSYNNQGYLSQITDPMGLTEYYNSYDYAGNVLSMTDKNSKTMHNVYGAFGLKKTYFSSLPDTKEYIYNNIGQIMTAKSVNADNTAVEESYSYDAFGRLTSMTSGDGSVQNYTYDSNSNITEYELIKDEVVKNSVEYAYNNLNRLTSLSNNDIITSYGYDANGNLIEKSLSNGVTTNYTYNKAGLMTYMESKKGGNVYTYSDCTYLLNGLLQRVYMPYDGLNNNETKTKHFNYDGMGRLTGEYIAAAAGVPIINSYEYDLRGNRIRMEGGEPDNLIEKETEYQYDLNNRLLGETNTVIYNNDNQTEASAIRYYYDNNGNMTAKQTTEYTNNSTGSSAALSGRSTDTGLSVYRYDAFNRLANYNSGSAEASYRYNANNLRSSKTVNRVKTEYVWNGQNLASETKNGAVNTYTYDITGIHIANQGGIVTSYLKDYHGNIVGRTNAAGAMLQEPRMDYDAFGNQWNGTAPDPFGYCGEYRDSESGLIYLRNRYYDSSTGRFITEDPVKDGVNWYRYCAGNPVNAWDPWGLWMDGDEELSQPAQDYTTFYGEKWAEAKKQYDECIAKGDVLGAEDAQNTMNLYHEKADDIRRLDAEGKVQGATLDVPKYNQMNTPPTDNSNNLCWATCLAMLISYYLGDETDRTLNIASYTRAFFVMLDGTPIVYNNPMHWISSNRFPFGVPYVQVQTEGIISMSGIKSNIDAGDPFGVLYGAYDSYDNWSGHWVLGVGYAVAEGHDSLVMSNDPWGGIRRISTYDEFQTCGPDDPRPWKYTAQ